MRSKRHSQVTNSLTANVQPPPIFFLDPFHKENAGGLLGWYGTLAGKKTALLEPFK